MTIADLCFLATCITAPLWITFPLIFVCPGMYTTYISGESQCVITQKIRLFVEMCQFFIDFHEV